MFIPQLHLTWIPQSETYFASPTSTCKQQADVKTSMSQPTLQHSATHSTVLVPLSNKGTDSASWILTWSMVMFSTDRRSERSKVRQGVAWVQWAFSTFFTQGHLTCLFFLNINLKKGDLAHLREEKELMTDIHTNMGKSQDNYVEWQKPDQKKRVNVLWSHFYKMLGNGKLWWQQADQWLPADGDKGRERLLGGQRNFWSCCRQSWSWL